MTSGVESLIVGFLLGLPAGAFLLLIGLKKHVCEQCGKPLSENTNQGMSS